MGGIYKRDLGKGGRAARDVVLRLGGAGLEGELGAKVLFALSRQVIRRHVSRLQVNVRQCVPLGAVPEIGRQEEGARAGLRGIADTEGEAVSRSLPAAASHRSRCGNGLAAARDAVPTFCLWCFERGEGEEIRDS